MLIKFTSSAVGSGRGFNATYRLKHCSTFTRVPPGVMSFTDGSGTDSYEGGLDCTWLIPNPTTTEAIRLTFTSLQTENGFDFVAGFEFICCFYSCHIVYDGSSRGAYIIGIYSGFSTSFSVTGTLTSSSKEHTFLYLIPTKFLLQNY
jgi:hypothetical protein